MQGFVCFLTNNFEDSKPKSSSPRASTSAQVVMADNIMVGKITAAEGKLGSNSREGFTPVRAHSQEITGIPYELA